MGSNKKITIENGDKFTVAFPFVEHTLRAGVWVWRPGCHDDTTNGSLTCDGEGEMTLTVRGIAKPEGFHTRVFYTREFKNPDGHSWQSNGLRVASIGHFLKISKSYIKKYQIIPF